MQILLLALALAAPGEHDSQERRAYDEPRCTLQVHALDELGQPQSARRVSATAVPAVVFRGRVESKGDPAPPLLFDVYSPRGLRYQVLLGTPRVRVTESHGERVERKTRTREA